MMIKHHGAVQGVTGSCHEFFFTEQASVLVDCGLFQGAESSDFEDGNFAIEFDLANVKALFVTHCHIDHIGRLPWLIMAGFKGPIFATKATAKLLPLVIEDALKIGVTRNQTIINKVLKLIDQLLVPVAYNQWIRPFEGVQGLSHLKAKFKVAGHILGSAYIEFDVNRYRTVFSGDLGATYSPLLPSPRAPYRADTLVIESTYGDKLHEGRRLRRKQLQSVLKRALKNQGTVLIPAFSIGRTQELLYEIEHLVYKAKSGRSKSDDFFADIDVIIDSPLAAKFTEVYSDLAHLWDKEARNRLAKGRHPLDFANLITVDSHSDHQRVVNHLKQTGRPSIVIAASGMCAGGRMMNYLKALLGDAKTDVLFVGYQAQGTPGRDIQTYGPRGGYVVLDNQRYDIRAKVYTLSGYSAHADQGNLVNFVKRMRHKPSEIRVVHGDDDAKRALRDKLLGICPNAKVLVPKKG